jgi:hypothetical protein
VHLSEMPSECASCNTPHIKLINTGQTPAKMVQVVNTTRILDHPIDAKFDIRLPADPDKSMITIGAGGELMFDAEADKIFSANEITEITNPKSRKRLYSYGTVKYQDIFGRKQYTDFCLFFETHRNNPKRELRTRVSAPEHHNDAS